MTHVSLLLLATHFLCTPSRAEDGYRLWLRYDLVQDVIAANSDIGVLYGVFHFLRLLQTHQAIEHLSVVTQPQIQLRLLDHWDNLDRTV